jgi:hypothetical protein
MSWIKRSSTSVGTELLLAPNVSNPPPQERGWGTALMAGDSEYYDYTIVTVEISLTPAGLKVLNPDGLEALMKLMGTSGEAGDGGCTGLSISEWAVSKHDRVMVAWLMISWLSLSQAWKDVLLAVYQYLDMMRTAGPQQYLFDVCTASCIFI